MTGGLTGRRFTSEQVAQVAGCSYRALDYWVRTGRIQPAVPARGSGSQRLFDYDQVLRARVLALASRARISPAALDVDLLLRGGIQSLDRMFTMELNIDELTRTTQSRIEEFAPCT